MAKQCSEDLERNMADWKTYKGQVPWVPTGNSFSDKNAPFEIEPSPDKLRYNEGNRIATYEDYRWTTGFTGEPVTPGHDPCGYWWKGQKESVEGYIVWAAGQNGYNCTGIVNSRLYLNVFTPVTNFPGLIRDITNGNNFGLAIRESDGFLFWIGLAGTYDYTVPHKLSGVLQETSWVPLDAGPWRSVSTSGTYHTLLAHEDGSLWACGKNTQGQLGFGDINQTYDLTKVGTGRFTKVLARGQSSYALAGTDLYVCGGNAYGNLGLGDTTRRTEFELSLTGCAHISTNVYGNTATAITTAGVLCGTGMDSLGQLGLNLADGSFVRRKEWAVADTSLRFKKSVITGTNIDTQQAGLFQTVDDDLYVAGYGGDSGGSYLGLGDFTTRLTLTQVPGIKAKDICDVVVNGHLYVDTAGDVYWTGQQLYGAASPNFTMTPSFLKVGEGFDRISGYYQNVHGWKFQKYITNKE
jgi:hypothetical protein